MLKHYITLALRTLWRKKYHTAINVAGLTVGITACLVIYLIVSFELSFNRGIPDYDRIYRVHSEFGGAFVGLNRAVPTAVAGYSREQLKGIEHVTMFITFSGKVAIPGTGAPKTFEEESAIAITSTDYFNVFRGYEWIVGSPAVLSKPHQVVLTESQARKYFGTTDLQTLAGREITYRDSITAHVGGIVHDLTYRTDLAFTEFISMPTIEASGLKYGYQLNSWSGFSSSTQIFMKAMPGTTYQQLEAQIPVLNDAFRKNSQWDALETFVIQPLSDLHYDPTTGIFDFSTDIAHRPTLVTLGGVAILLLIIGSINFINLETAQALRRAKEVGVRKVLGSTRTRLIAQFVCEGMLLTLAAVLLALPFTELSLSTFSEFVPAGVRFDIVAMLPVLLFITVFIGVLASSYPAFVLSGFLPAVVLKSQSQGSTSSGSAYLRKVLIIFQFTFAQVLILGTVLVGSQIQYVLNKDLGFRRDAVVYFRAPSTGTAEKVQELKHELETLPGMARLALSDSPPADNGWSSSLIEYYVGNEKLTINAFRKFGDENYIPLYDMQILAGRNLQPSDTIREVIINETMATLLGFSTPQEALGTQLKITKGKKPIVGVVKDFHTQSLRSAIEPVIIANETNVFRCFNIQLAIAGESGQTLHDRLEQIEKAWKKVYPDAPFEYSFLDDTVRNFYKTEQRTSKLAYTATALAIFISCLGLFGLASYTSLQRTREIGIRKIFGATVQQIVMLLSKDFIILVAVAFLLAAPIAWFSMNLWLERFTYRITPGIWMFILTAVVTALIAFATVGYQTLKASARNPVDSLRHE